MNNTKQFINTQISVYFWMAKNAWKYFLLNFQSISTVSKNYIFLLLLFVLITPWLSGRIWLSLFADILSLIAFLQNIQDKIQIETDKEFSRQRIQNAILSEADEILEYFGELKISPIRRIELNIIQGITYGISDYEYFDDNRFKYILKLSDEILQAQNIDNDLRFYLRYLIFSELKTKYRQRYIDENINVRNLSNPDSKETYLVKQIAYRFEAGEICKDSSYQSRKYNLDNYIAIEFGDKIGQIKIQQIINDKERAEKFKDILTKGLINGVISERGLESITRNQNKLLVIIKYGEGTSQKGWPKKEGAPLAKVLRNNKFEKPYYQDNFAFIRDLSANPIEGDLEKYLNSLIKEMEKNFSSLKAIYKNREIIQEGPYYEILAFIADKQNFAWKLSRKRNFNSFVSRILLNEVLESDFSQDFIRANYFKIRKIIESTVWFSLMKNKKLRGLIEQNINKIANELLTNNISLETLFDFVSLSRDQITILENTIFNVVKKNNISVRKSKTTEKDKREVIKNQIESLLSDAEQFTSIVRDLEK